MCSTPKAVSRGGTKSLDLRLTLIVRLISVKRLDKVQAG
jgi:hypothetical protein